MRRPLERISPADEGGAETDRLAGEIKDDCTARSIALSPSYLAILDAEEVVGNDVLAF